MIPSYSVILRWSKRYSRNNKNSYGVSICCYSIDLQQHFIWKFFISYLIRFEIDLWEPLREKCPYLVFFWSVFSRITSECEKTRTRKNLNADTFHAVSILLKHTLREECPNTELFLVRIFLRSEWIRREYLSVFTPNMGKYRPEKTPYLDTFHTVI